MPQVFVNIEIQRKVMKSAEAGKRREPLSAPKKGADILNMEKLPNLLAEEHG